MKIFFVILMIFLSFFSLARGETLEVKVKGMVCAFCANGIESKLKDLEKVKKIDVSLEKKRVLIEFDGKALLSDKEVTKLIIDTGYNVVSIKRTKTPIKGRN